MAELVFPNYTFWVCYNGEQKYFIMGNRVQLYENIAVIVDDKGTAGVVQLTDSVSIVRAE